MPSSVERRGVYIISGGALIKSSLPTLYLGWFRCLGGTQANQVGLYAGLEVCGKLEVPVEERTQRRQSPVEPGKFNSPHSIATDERGNIYVAERLIGGRFTKLVKMVPITGGTPARLVREASVQRRDFITPGGVGHPLVYFHLGKRDSDFEAVEPRGNGSII